MEDKDSGTNLSNFEEYTKYSEPDRKRGIFTSKDREYLLDKIDISGQDERNLRYRTRQRVFESFLDIILLERYPDKELQNTINSDFFPITPVIKSLLQLAYRIASSSYDQPEEELGRELERAISSYQTDRNVTDADIHETTVKVEVDISIEYKETRVREHLKRLVKDPDADMDDYKSIDTYIRIHYQKEDLEQIIEGNNLVAIQPWNIDDEIEVHPVLAELIKQVQEED